MTTILPPRLSRTAGNSALRSSQQFDKDSMLVQSSTRADVRELAWDDIEVGRLLGKGGFNNVNEVRIHTKDGRDERVYAIKYLRNSVMQRRHALKVGAGDLVMECKLLSHLSHENIVKLHGVSEGALLDSYKNNRRYFLIVDLLTCTLEDKILAWNFEEEKFCRQTRLFPFFGISESQKVRLYERMSNVAIPVAHTLQYLHSKNIVFRDLKPENIGFDAAGTLKLFDFGMAREIKEGRKLTGNTGSPLYMSPENALSQDYGLEADVYSFAYILWELATLKVPFEGYTREKHARKILVDDGRPRVDNRCGSTRMQQLIIQCWDRSPKSRPSFAKISAVLQIETNRKLETESVPRSSIMRSLVPSKFPLARAA